MTDRQTETTERDRDRDTDTESKKKKHRDRQTEIDIQRVRDRRDITTQRQGESHIETHRRGEEKGREKRGEGNGFEISDGDFIIRAQTRPYGNATKYGPIMRDIAHNKETAPSAAP